MEQISQVPLKNEISSHRSFVIATILSIFSSVAVSFLFSRADWKTLLVALSMTTIAPMLMIIPIQNAILLYFGYLFLDGAIKINSNYNPIFHVAQDLLMMVLFFRSCYGNENAGISKFGRTPHIGLGMIFLGWLLLQYINPFGLGFLPSIAGTKVYLSMFAFFLLIYHHLPRTSITGLLRGLLILSVLEGMIALVEYFYGQDFVVSLNPHYREIIEGTFNGAFYRPFGTTAVAGGPAMWIAFSAPIAGYFLQKKQSSWLDKTLAIVLLTVALPTLLVCQVRSLMLMSALGFLGTFCRPSPGILGRLASAIVIASIFGYVLTNTINTVTPEGNGWTSRLSGAQRQVLFQRFMTLNHQETYQGARIGGWDEAMALADKTMLGIGLSRVGSAAAVWAPIIEKDPYFGIRWAFADNLYKAIFTEVGIFGLLAWLIFVLSLIGTNLIRSIRNLETSRDQNLMWMCGTFCLVLLIAGVGSEGILYNPVSAIFWAFQAIGLKEAVCEFA